VVGIVLVVIFAGVALCAVVGAVNVVLVVDSSSGELSAVVAVASLVGCGCWGKVGALSVCRAGVLSIVLVVGSVVSGVVVVGCSVVVGCVVDIGGVGGFIVRKVVVSRIKPARMLAFSASKSMRCGKVFAFVAVVSVVVVVVCVVGIGVVVSIIFRRFVVSCSKPARMLACSATRSMHCGGGVMGSVDGIEGVSLVGAGGGVIGVVGSIVICTVGIVIWEAVSRIRPARMLAFSALKSIRCGGAVLNG